MDDGCVGIFFGLFITATQHTQSMPFKRGNFSFKRTDLTKYFLVVIVAQLVNSFQMSPLAVGSPSLTFERQKQEEQQQGKLELI